MAADDGKRRRPGADPQALIDAESFWDDPPVQDAEEEVTAPHQRIPTASKPQARPQPPPQARPKPPPQARPKPPPQARPQPPPQARPQPPRVEDDEDEDMAVVGLDALFQDLPGQPQPPPQPPPQARPQPTPQARPQPTPQARPQPTPQARPAPPAQARPRPARPKPIRPAPPVDVELEEEGISPIKLASALVAVAALAAFLGWFLIGRHAGTETPVEADPLLDEIEQAARTVPQAETQPKPKVTPDPTPTAASKVTVTLKVNSQPPGAQVFVDGEHRGVTPATVKGLPTTGQASLKVMLDGHKPWEQKIALDNQDLEREVTAGLVKQGACKAGAGFLYITTRPAGATIELDGKRLPGKTPKVINDVCAGVPHKVKLEKAGFRPWRQDVRVKPDDIHNLKINLEH